MSELCNCHLCNGTGKVDSEFNELDLLIQNLSSSDYSKTDCIIDTAMNRFSDAFALNQDIKDIEAWGRTIIINSLKNSARDRKLEPINIEGDEYEGMHGYEIK